MQKILIIDDSEPIHALVRARLVGESGIELHSAYDGESGLRAARELMPDLVLLDVEMPQPDGFEVCRRLKSDPAMLAIPVIFLTGAASTEQKIHGLNLGAVDYVTKPFDPAELRARVRASLRTKYLMDLLARKAMIDGLTGLWNRAYFDQRLVSEVSQSSRSGRPLSCIMMDVDHFKSVNDRWGHPFGDEILRSLGQILSEQCRTEDVVCRYGGEEFVILTPGVETTGAEILAHRLRNALAGRALRCAGQSIPVTCSFGVAGTENAPPSDLVERADQALYSAKEAGRDRIILHATGLSRLKVNGVIEREIPSSPEETLTGSSGS